MGPIWDPSGQPAYGLTHMGPMPNPVALPIRGGREFDPGPVPYFRGD